MRALLNLTTALLRCTVAFLRSRKDQAIVELAPRQQLATYTVRPENSCWRRSAASDRCTQANEAQPSI